MARIAGVELPNKRIEVALTYIFGIGRSTSNKILNEAKVDKNKRTNELSDDEIQKLRNIIEKNLKVEGDLKNEIALNIKRLKDIRCYRGLRHQSGLPVRGQRTRTNSRTRKGPRGNRIGAKKKKAAVKE
ncbi:MAG: 30S ribosomal protein S13 [Spirochaetes bacterium]|jgi:small subunit ribosomal protein S13|nr:30S ribosomal protein S13 [Spirochaetota bacterium]NLJ05818.1 30S ribosomal protein S13 [Exilispira sp.]MBP8990816.1 30S ribosomal protein S13 [Spirochaetota bacterium]HNV44068.1 30S ribosomal protein S13 [Exilispira sp.]HOV45609.1 30S ribosomal protein S13 [Exilispira sp.]